MSVIDVKKPFQRLPKDVVPLHYKITLKPDLVKFVFTGSEVVHVKVVKSTSDIILNVKEIDITEATYSQSKDGSGAIKGSVTIEKNNDKAIIKFNEALKTGEGYLKLVFKGVHNDKMAGFYRTKYKSPVTGQETYAVTTQFEATDARRAFPCWDEPAIKARFEVTIIGPKDRVILSNTNVAKEEDDPSDPKLRIVHFEPTPIMSTYLLCFIVGEFESISSKTSRGIKVRVFTQFGKLNQGSFALNDGVKYIEFFEDYFKIPYPLNKLDHIAIPDFAFNAMENWGLVTYRESALLVDPEATSFSSKQNISMVIAHETAHQWFGNLVTMEWWTHLWLNEGFASFMQYLAVESNHPDFEYWKQFAVASSIEALDIDCSHRSHAIEIPVGAPEEISSIFDHISYHKGASVIRMCYSWINDQCFRMGMKNYLTEHAYKNAVTEELWKALEVASKKPVEKMMPSWTGQMGYPVINVNIVNQDSKIVLTLSQERFTINGKLDGKESKQLWMIPISLITSNKPKEEQKFDLLKDKTMQISIDQVPTNGWIKLNPSMYGFYRVNYPISMWKALGEGVKSKTLSPLDRLAVIDDLTALCFAGKVSAIEVFKMLEFYANEDDYVSWAGVDRALERIGTLLAYTDLYKGFQNFARKLVLHAFEKLGFDKKPDERCTNSLMRSLVISRLIQLKDEKVLHECKKRFDSHVQNKNLAADLRASVYKAVTKLGDTNDHEALFKLYHETELQEEKLRIAVALGASNNEHKIDQVLKFAFSEHVRNQNAWQVILGVTGTVKGRELAWKFYKHNIKEIKERFGSHRSSAVLIQKTTENFACEEMAKEVSSFFEKHPFAGLEDVIARAIERIHVNSDWLKRESGSLKDYLTV